MVNERLTGARRGRSWDGQTHLERSGAHRVSRAKRGLLFELRDARTAPALYCAEFVFVDNFSMDLDATTASTMPAATLELAGAATTLSS